MVSEIDEGLPGVEACIFRFSHLIVSLVCVVLADAQSINPERIVRVVRLQRTKQLLEVRSYSQWPVMKADRSGRFVISAGV